MHDTTQHNSRLDLASLRARLSASRGEDYWRSLEELADAEGFQELLRRALPRKKIRYVPMPGLGGRRPKRNDDGRRRYL